MRSVHEIAADIELLVEELKQIPGSNRQTSASSSRNRKRSLKRQSVGPKGLKGAILKLSSDGFFDKARTLSEIKAKLKDKGVPKPATSLMSPLLALVRDDELDRSKSEKGQYQYFKPVK